MVHSAAWKWFFLAAGLFGIIFMLRFTSYYFNNPNGLSRNFQHKVDEAWKTLKLETEKTTFLLDQKNGKIKPEFFWNFQDSKSDQIYLYIFRNDTLLYWNDNTLSLPAKLSAATQDTTFACRMINGWYLLKIRGYKSFRVVAAIPVKWEYTIRNEFIFNHFSSYFPFHSGIGISEKQGIPIYGDHHKVLFRLVINDKTGAAPLISTLIIILFFVGSLALSLFIYSFLSALSWLRSRNFLFLFIFTALLVGLRIVQCSAGFPEEMAGSKLFSPAGYSSSSILPSLGDYALNATLLLMVSLAFFKRLTHENRNGQINRYLAAAHTGFVIFIILSLTQVLTWLIRNLVINSSFSLNLQNLAAFTGESAAGVVIIASLLTAFWLITTSLLEFSGASAHRPVILFMIFMVVSILTLLMFHGAGHSLSWETIGFAFIYLVVFWFGQRLHQRGHEVQHAFLLIGLFALFSATLLNNFNRTKEVEKLNLLAGRLVTQRNPVTEVLYDQVQGKLRADTLVHRFLNADEKNETIKEDSLIRHLTKTYFNEYWDRYQVQITCCLPGKELKIQPQGYLVNCNAYFTDVIREVGKSTLTDNLFFLDYGLGKEYYLARFSRNRDNSGRTPGRELFMEFVLKNSISDPGYPGLLMDKSRVDLPQLADYSYALFQKGRLIRSAGKQEYRMNLNQYLPVLKHRKSFEMDNSEHFYFKVNGALSLLISIKRVDLLTLATPFSYLFVLYTILALIFFSLFFLRSRISISTISLRNRLQLIFTGILLITMVVIGIVQVVYIIQINRKKDLDSLFERTSSVVTEVQHKYSALDKADGYNPDDVGDFLIKISNVFFTEINLYDTTGKLFSSSRPQIFEVGLLAGRMNAEACRKMIGEKAAVFIHPETIGRMEFNSAYMPFFNEGGQLLGFVNLPYFSRQDNAKREVSSFLVTFLNIYILIIIFSIIVIVLISNYITAPLAMLAARMSHIRLGGSNERIVWRHQDEIGQLVAKYNQMIDELGRSADLLAQSERESAWREMARQVAHEIKNPLTPMKLSTQYLEKAWKERSPDWDERLERFTRNMVEQIDALSLIASDFSDFARMQTNAPVKLDLAELIPAVLSLYQHEKRIQIIFTCECSHPVVYGDKARFTRVITNLINNAIQAIGDRDGQIFTRISQQGKTVCIQISDNGCGISGERISKIFQPNFTTKTSGMGLGLAIVKGIIEGMEGTITFTSKENQGTTFTINLPEYDEQIDEKL